MHLADGDSAGFASIIPPHIAPNNMKHDRLSISCIVSPPGTSLKLRPDRS